MFFRQVNDARLAQYAYLIGCPDRKEALVVDPERDIDRYIALAAGEGYKIVAVAETHIHADFLSGAREFAERLGIRLYLSDEGDKNWKYEWAQEGSYDVHLLTDGDRFRMGNVEIKAVHTPGHTPEHLSFMVTDRGGGADKPRGLITGDFVFVGDAGRPDLLESAAEEKNMMEPSARRLYQSIKWFDTLSDYLQVWPGHGAGSACGKALGSVPNTTVGYEKQFNPALKAAKKGEDQFIEYILSDQPDPPLYFSRMKHLNKTKVPLLGDLPQPERLSAKELGELAGRADAVVLDTREDRTTFMQGHLPGAVYVPFDRTFPTVAGSYVDPGQPVYLIVREEDLEAAVRNLVRVGLDNVAGYASLEIFEEYVDQEGKLASAEIIGFEETEQRRRSPDIHVLDVRSSSEYRAGHIPKSQNIAHTRLLERVNEVPQDKQIVVHCGSGKRAASAASLLDRYGYQVSLVNDLWKHWEQPHAGEMEREEAGT